MKEDEYNCAQCRETFTKAWSDEEATEEANEMWADEIKNGDLMVVICDDCFKRIIN